MRPHPHLYEVSARLLVERWSRRLGREARLLDVPDPEWARLARLGFDLVWLMGAWRRSPAARDAALGDPGLRVAYDRALPGWSEADVAASPYAVLAWELDPRLGAPGDLAALRDRLRGHGLGLVVDFVPNHLARDHAWTREHPERLVQGTDADIARHPERFFRVPGADRALAHGRDPHFAPWTDTVQVDFFSPGLRAAHVEALVAIAGVADAVRCDMAMLALDPVFERTWGEVVRRAPPPRDYWSEVIGAVRARAPGLRLIAEAYWDTEWELQQRGFDWTYDKRLYDRLRGAGAGDVRGHLRADPGYQRRSLRFVENHDEERAAAAFGPERSLAAAAVALSVPGLRLVHDGQLEGRRVRVPVQLVREPDEPDDAGVAAFYRRLLAALDEPPFHEGAFELLATEPAAEAPPHGPIVAWRWSLGESLAVVAVNLSDAPAAARIALGADVAGGTRLAGRLGEGDATAGPGGTLDLALPAWGAAIHVGRRVAGDAAPAAPSA